jgi:hypothetical protein
MRGIRTGTRREEFGTVARPYAHEMGKLAQTLAWAGSAPIDDLARAVGAAALGPLVAVGSGGSLSAAHFLAQTHQRLAGQLARTATPAELTNEPAPRAAAVWLLSAGGGNANPFSPGPNCCAIARLRNTLIRCLFLLGSIRVSYAL